MYLGQLVEEGPVEELFGSAHHPYTQALLSASPSIDPARRQLRIVLEGDIPSPMNPPSGCHFRTRCRHAMAVCADEEPAATQVGQLVVRCHLMTPTRDEAPEPDSPATTRRTSGR